MAQKYLVEKEFNEIVSRMDDYRDQLLFKLVWNGYFKEGYKTLENIKSISTDDDELKALIKKALNEKEVTIYSLSNTDNRWKEKLVESDYLLRQTIKFTNRKNIEIGKEFNGYAMNRTAIINRVTMLKARFKDELDGESLQTIYFAGIMDRVIQNINIELPENIQRTMAIDYLINVERLKKGRAYGYWNTIKNELIARGDLIITKSNCNMEFATNEV